jgi:valyl-tRNA synthetase
MTTSKTYSPQEFENKWYSYWMEQQFFKSVPDHREPYTIVIPPPNVTGMLHMGHMLNNTIQDVLIRRARMMGKNACWVPGTDHASIATETKVVNLLREKGIEKTAISRAEFLAHAYDWKDKYGGIILEQLKKLGASCDWDRTKFTMDPDLSEGVTDAFINLYNKGLIYRGVRMVNWDPKGLTAVSDEEVIRKEVNQKLVYINYQIVGEANEFLTIATTRPETIMADAAICINPKDERYFALHGKSVFIPLIQKEIPIILDEYVDIEFGTGCLKVTPAHDLNDYELGIRHHLPVIDILNDNGTLNEKAQILINEDRFIARKKIIQLLEDAGRLLKVEEYKSQVGFSERTDAVIEPKLSMQWFCKMTDMAKPALDAVLSGEVKLIPEKYTNTYKHWMDNVKDWCISRQLWWGQQIPAFYAPNGDVVVAKTVTEALQIFQQNTANASLTIADLKQDEDVVDTWFSSWLWPIAVFDTNVFGEKPNKGNADLNYYYPTNDLVTGPDILFFWVARMIMAGQEFKQAIPFKNVYLTGIVRDKVGRKMSKSLGNSPDPIELMNQYGADGVRVGMLLCAPAGNDLMFDESYCEQGRNFANKIWNAFKMVKGLRVDPTMPNKNSVANEWFAARFNEALKEIESSFDQYKLSEALMACYKLVWDDFCSWYLEMVKPAFVKNENGEGVQDPIDTATHEFMILQLSNILSLLHPFMPFLTEELWHDEELFGQRATADCCIVSSYPTSSGNINQDLLQKVAQVKLLVSEIRMIRNSKQIAPKVTLPLAMKLNTNSYFNETENLIVKLANLSEFTTLTENPAGAISFMVSTHEFFINLGTNIDEAAERKKAIEEIAYLEGFLISVDKKLSNEKFVQNAKPEVIANEQKKRADAETKIAALKKLL